MTKKQILIVEDDRIISKNIKIRLEKLEFTVSGCIPSGEKAIQNIKANKPDLVLMDIMLEGEMDGIEAANQIRRQFNIPVIYLTAYADDTLLERAKITEPFGYIIKPFHDRELKTTVEIALYKHKIECKLKNSEEKYRSIMESMNESAYICSPEKRIAYMNPAMIKMLGHDATGESCNKAIFGLDKKCPWCVFEKVQKGESVVIDLHNPKDNRHYRVSHAPIFHTNQTISKMTIYYDVTDLKMAKEAQTESERRFQSISTAANDAIIMMDDGGKILFWNKSAEKIFGYLPEEIIGKDLHHTIAPQRYHNDFLKGFSNFKQTGTGAAIDSTLELAGLKKGGKEFPVELSLSSVKSKGKWHAIGLIRDISKRKQAEEKLKKAKTDAETANTAKSKFLANVSHEIRTPMNGVIGMTGLLMDTDLNDDQREYAEIVRSSGESLLVLINDILDFSKIEAGKLEFEVIDFQLINTVESAVGLLSIKAAGKNLEFLCYISPDLPLSVRGDPGRLRQIIMNLAGNAIKFTEKGEVAVFVESEQETDHGVMLKIRISDTGIGIPKERIQDIFAPFTQADGSTTRIYGGTGLGLSISKQLVEKMGGELCVESIEGKGSTFWFTTWFEKTETTKDAKPVFTDLTSVKVLVVDCNATNLRILTNYLKTWKCRYSQAKDAKTALDILINAAEQNDPFQVVILNMVMLDEDGESLGRRIKADNRISETSLILMTSIGEKGDAKRFSEIGFSGFLSKPVRHRILHDTIALALGREEKPETGNKEPIITQYVISEARKKNTRILLVEDDKTNQNVAKGILIKLGYSCDVSENGQEALESLSRTSYDLVLMDCQMPVMNGFTATQKIRNSKLKNSNLPIIALTADAMRGDRKKCLAAGMNDYIAKPFEARELADKLDEWLNKH